MYFYVERGQTDSVVKRRGFHYGVGFHGFLSGMLWVFSFLQGGFPRA